MFCYLMVLVKRILIMLCCVKYLPQKIKRELAELSASNLYDGEKQQTHIRAIMLDTYFREKENRSFYLTLHRNLHVGVVVVDSFEKLHIIKIAVVNSNLQNRGIMRASMNRIIDDSHGKILVVKTANPRMGSLLFKSGFIICNDEINHNETFQNSIIEYQQQESVCLNDSIISYNELSMKNLTPALQKGTEHMERMFKKMKSNPKDRIVFLR